MCTLSNHQRTVPKRGKVTCWSPGAARRNVAFLRSVREDQLEGVGIAFTLTIRDCPPDPASWASCIDRWVKRQRRGGCSVLHWVMEFQLRGVPHLHVAAWYDPSALRPATVAHQRRAGDSVHRADDGTPDHQRAAVVALCDWLDVSKAFGARAGGQQARPIAAAVGWFQYLAKHCGRGRGHYQRQQQAMPKVWPSAPRAWGKSGPWPLQEPCELRLGSRDFYRLRRLVRAQRVARARAAVPGPGWSWQPGGAPLLTRQDLRAMPITPKLFGAAATPLRIRLRHLQGARRMLSCPLRKLSEVRGVSEWITEAGQDELLRAIGATRDDLQELNAEP